MTTHINQTKDDDSLTPLLEETTTTLNEHDEVQETTLGNVSTFDQAKHHVGKDLTTATLPPVATASSNTTGPTHVTPPSTIPINKNTSSQQGEDQKTCRICGEGEEEDEEDTSYSDYDEESQIRNPESTPFMTRNHSSSSSSSNAWTPRDNKKWIQQKNPLIRPCRCKGTMMYVHVSCLNRWRSLSPRASSYVACDLCGYQYNIYRPRYAAIVTNVHFLRLMTAFLVIISILICAYLCKFVDVYLFGHLPRPDRPDWMELHGPTWLWMDRFYLGAGLIVISLLGMVYLTYLCVSRPYALGSMAQQSSGAPSALFCCDQTSCPWYSCYLADVAACSGDAAAGGFLVFLVLMSLLAILFGILGAVTGVYRWMEACVDRVAGHVKERILDVD